MKKITMTISFLCLLFLFQAVLAQSVTIRENGRTNSYQFYRIEPDFCDHCKLPQTGFPTKFSSRPLSVRPPEIEYKNLRLSIQIPVLNVETDIVGVPESGDSWAVEWLGASAGLLNGSSLPGEGITVIAGHNTLNDTDLGPFALLSTIEENDVIFVNQRGKITSSYSVYANKLLEPDDMDELLAVAAQAENALVLVNCENESESGSYQNRRVIFARPR